jgi:TraM recognition site of TraD and TraG
VSGTFRSKDFLDAVLQMFSATDPWTARDAFEGTFISGSPGSGKSANVTKNIIYSFLRAGMGGLVLVAKAEETRNWIEYAKATARYDDLILLNAESGHCFDPLFYAWNREGRGQGDLETIIDFISTLQAIGKKEEGHGHDPFWERGNQQLIRNVIKLIDLAGARLSLVEIDRVIKSLPTRPGEHEEEAWQKTSYCASLINAIRARKDTLTAEQWSDLDIATQFALVRWPAFDERPRSSLEMTWSGIADKFLFNPFNRIFCSGKCTFVPEMTTHQNKIVICDFPILEYGYETGRLINVLIKLIFQSAWLRRDVREAPNGVFLVADEMQYFIHRRDNSFQQTCRGSRVATCYITQNILNLSEELGEHIPGSKTKSFLANLALKVFAQQNDPDTNNYAADLIGKEWRFVDSFHANAGASGQQSANASVGGAMQLVHRVEPTEFSRLTKPNGNNPLVETIVYFGGKTFNATITNRNPEGRNYLKLAFSRDISQ